MEGSPLMKVSEALRTIVCEGLAVDDFKVFNCGTPWEFIVVPTIPQGERILRRDGREFVGKSLLSRFVRESLYRQDEILWALRDKKSGGVEFLGVIVSGGILSETWLFNLKKSQGRKNLQRLEIFLQKKLAELKEENEFLAIKEWKEFCLQEEKE